MMCRHKVQYTKIFILYVTISNIVVKQLLRIWSFMFCFILFHVTVIFALDRTLNKMKICFWRILVYYYNRFFTHIALYKENKSCLTPNKNPVRLREKYIFIIGVHNNNALKATIFQYIFSYDFFSVCVHIFR